MRRRTVLFAAIALAVIGVDQWTKLLVLRELTSAFDGASGTASVFYGEAPAAAADGYHFRPTRNVVLSTRFFQLRYAENPGAAFGLFKNLPEHVRGPLFHLVSLGAVVLIAFSFRGLKGGAGERFALAGLPLVLGGALGNYVDRLARGFVIDFFEAHWHEAAWWPAFNVADAAICVGVGLLLVDSFVRREAPAAQPSLSEAK